jgi:hypothetical protein
MVSINHTRNAVEAEAIKVVFVHPESQIAKKEAQDLMTAIVEKSTIP